MPKRPRLRAHNERYPMAKNRSTFAVAPFKFGMRQVVKHEGRAGTVIGRAEHAASEPTYLVRDIDSQSVTDGTPRKQSELRAF